MMAWRYTFALLAFLGAIETAVGDEVVLINGDRLNGRIAHKAGDVLEFETRYAGLIKVKWSDVISLATDAPIDVLLLGDEKPVRATLISAFDGTVDLIGIASDVPLMKITHLNPTPEESGVGAIYNAHVNIASTHVRGNAINDQTYADGDFTGRSKYYRYILGGKLSHLVDHGVTVGSNWLLNAELDRFLSDKRFLYLRGTRERDPFKDIDRRTTVGAGYGFQFIETLRTNVSVRLGEDYVELNRLVGPDESYPAFGWGVRATHKLGPRGTELFHEQDGFWNLRDSDQLTLRSRTGLRIPVFRGLNATIQVNFDWERQPAEGRKPGDTTLVFGLGYSW